MITLYESLRTIPIVTDESPNDHINLSIDESNDYNDHKDQVIILHISPITTIQPTIIVL